MHVSATAPPSDAIAEIEQHARAGAVAASPWIEGLGRFGYVAKGVVYLTVGVLAVQAALGRGGETTDQPGALAHIAEVPYGRVLLVVMTVGLVGYAIWKAVQGLLDTDRKGTDAQGLLARVTSVGVCGLYLGLAYSAFRIALGDGGVKGSSQQTRDWTAWLMGQSFGVWLVGLVGLLVIGNGLLQLYRAVAADPCTALDCREIGPESRTWIRRLGRAGYVARGIAFLTIGGLLEAAATYRDPSEAQGLDGALATLAGQPFGPYLLGLVAVGLAAYGVFALVEARHRRMVIC
jgi:uncharacterized protein DUF1206